MTRIIIVSDTHMPHMAETLPETFISELKKSDLCLHAGDLVELSTAEEISKYVKLIAVHGNMDSISVTKKFKKKELIKIEDILIGITHGTGGPKGIIERVIDTFKEDSPDIIIFGHSHKAYNKIHNNILCFNPGSLTDYLYAEYNSYGILTIDGKQIKTELVRI